MKLDLFCAVMIILSVVGIFGSGAISIIFVDFYKDFPSNFFMINSFFCILIGYVLGKIMEINMEDFEDEE